MELVLFYFFVLTLPKIFLSILQIRFLSQEQHKSPYILAKSEFIQAASYAIAKEKIAIAEIALEIALLGFWLFYGLALLDGLWLSGIEKSVAFVLIFLVCQNLLTLPISIYKKRLDYQYGFAKGGIGLFVMDWIKSFLLLVLLGGGLIWAFVWIMDLIAYWWAYGFALSVVLVVMINLLYPTLFAPIFNNFTPLQNQELNKSIQSLLQRVGFQSNGVFVMDASKRDGRLNAYFAGIGASKRVILFDTLLDKIPKQSLLAILGHELGHFKHFDLYKNIALIIPFLFCIFWLAGNTPPALFSLASLNQTPETTIILLIFLSNIIGFYFMPILSYVSCQNEFNADQFGASLTSPQDLAKALIILVKENKAFPLSHPLYMKFYYSHPPLFSRLSALGCQHLAQ